MGHSTAVIKRRRLLAVLALGAAGVVGGVYAQRETRPQGQLPGQNSAEGPPGKASGATSRDNPIVAENRHRGSADWRGGRQGTTTSDDVARQIQGYASATSVLAGESIDFHISVDRPQGCTLEVYRLGAYGGAGARRVMDGRRFQVGMQPMPPADPVTGRIGCTWPVAWRLKVPESWTSGLYMAVMTSASRFRACVPFVVRGHGGRLCVVLPFTTYQAYNPWPMDGVTGKSLYYGYVDGSEKAYEARATEVSFDRPYPGGGVPDAVGKDHEFVRWAETQGYDLTYATSVDLHAGRIDPKHYAGLIFPGHDEYWSRGMRDVAERAVAGGTSLAFLSANNVYWQVRLGQANGGRPHRVMACHKTDADPEQSGRGRTTKWRGIAGSGPDAEQGLLGVQYSGKVDSPQPLVVASASHWFWSGCGVRDGERIPKVVGGEADGFDPEAPRPAANHSAMLSASPFWTPQGVREQQNTHVHEAPAGGLVFVAGSVFWPLALHRPGYVDARVQRATANLFTRMLS
jgi:hypothetical protein